MAAQTYRGLRDADSEEPLATSPEKAASSADQQDAVGSATGSNLLKRLLPVPVLVVVGGAAGVLNGKGVLRSSVTIWPVSTGAEAVSREQELAAWQHSTDPLRALKDLPRCYGFQKCPDYPVPYANGGWPEKYSYKGTFPDDFVWGMGTAAYQIEGGYREGGRGASIWDTFTGADTVGMPGGNCSYCCKKAPCHAHDAMKAKGATGNVACDHYHRWKADVALMKSMGLRNYRFSIAWSRLFPSGESSGKPNPEGVKFYNDLVDELLGAGITPYVTLYHWDLPQALLDPPRVNGWWARDEDGNPIGEILPAWLHYVDTCFTLFGDRVKTWTTFNEAWTFTYLASGFGKAPSLPEFSDMSRDPWIAGHNVLNAHAAAVALYRTKFQKLQGGQIGITNNQDWREPASYDPEDVAAAERAVEFQFGWFSDPIFSGTGDYPAAMREIYGDRLPKFSEEQKKLINGSADFLGLNHYGTGFARFSPNNPGSDSSYMALSEKNLSKGQSAWLYSAAWGFRKLLNWVSTRYKGVPIYVTESGWSIAANNAADGTQDRVRLEYYANYTGEMYRAMTEDGVDVRGYFAWSLMDNFEWEMGYAERFGTTFTDFAPEKDPRGPANATSLQPSEGHQRRERKQSSCWLEAVWRSNQLVDPKTFRGCVKEEAFNGSYMVGDGTGCIIGVTMGPFPNTAYITGWGKFNRTSGSCRRLPDSSWGPLPGNLSGSTITADLSTLGLPGDHAGYWNRADRTIHWSDGGVWTASEVPTPVTNVAFRDTEKKEKRDKGAAPAPAFRWCGLCVLLGALAFA